MQMAVSLCEGNIGYHIDTQLTVAPFLDQTGKRISKREKKRYGALKQNRRSVGETDKLLDELGTEIKPYNRIKDSGNRARSLTGRKEKILLEQYRETIGTTNDTPVTTGNLPAFDILDVNNDLYIRRKTVSIRDSTQDCPENTQGKTRDLLKNITTKKLEFSEKANCKVKKCTALTVGNETCQSIRKQQVVDNLSKEASCNQTKSISDPFIGGHHHSTNGNLSLSSSLFGHTLPFHDIPEVEDIDSIASEKLFFTELDILSLPHEETGIDSEDQILTDSSKHIGGVEKEQTGDITLENTLIDLGIRAELGNLSEIHESDENSDLEDSEEFSGEETPKENNDGFQADLKKLVDESNSTKSITPLLKKELQYKIQYQRLERGDDELKLEPGSPIVYKLTEEEIRKKNNRREQNRRSAVKARVRAKEHALKLKQTIQREASEKFSLLAERRKLREMKLKLMKELSEHMSICRKPQSVKELTAKICLSTS